MKYLSVCSGIEAATCAWHPLGWQAAGFAEIDKFPSAVLAHHYPHVRNHGDFTGIEASDVGSIDLLVGGTPCQSFSVAGLRGGLADDRGNLALEFLRLAYRTRPQWLVWENVPGVLSSNGGRDFGSILGGLGELGYGWAYRVLDAQYFGVPQRRRRVFVVGHLGDRRRAAAVLFERHSLQGHPAPRRQAGEGIAGTIAAGAHPSGFNGRDAERGNVVTHALRADGFDASEDGTGRGTPIIAFNLRGRDGGSQPEPDHLANIRAASGGSSRSYIAFDTTQITSAENRCQPQPGDPCHPIPAHGHAPAIAFSSKDHGADAGELDWQNDLSDTLQAKNPKGVASGSAVRRLTPEECEALQGFRRGYTLIPMGRALRKAVDEEMAAYYRRTQPELTDAIIRTLAADGPRYRALGNSMAVPVMRWIGERIDMVEALGAAPAILEAAE